MTSTDPHPSASSQQQATIDETAIRTKGQRRINLLWECTQASIAIAVVVTTLAVTARIALLIIDTTPNESQLAHGSTAFMLLSNLVSLVIGFYFGRTNHTRQGGISSEKEER